MLSRHVKCPTCVQTAKLVNDLKFLNCEGTGRDHIRYNESTSPEKFPGTIASNFSSILGKKEFIRWRAPIIDKPKNLLLTRWHFQEHEPSGRALF